MRGAKLARVLTAAAAAIEESDEIDDELDDEEVGALMALAHMIELAGERAAAHGRCDEDLSVELVSGPAGAPSLLQQLSDARDAIGTLWLADGATLAAAIAAKTTWLERLTVDRETATDEDEQQRAIMERDRDSAARAEAQRSAALTECERWPTGAPCPSHTIGLCRRQYDGFQCERFACERCGRRMPYCYGNGLSDVCDDCLTEAELGA